MQLMMIVNDPRIARYVATHGVDRIFVDLESLGKLERQGHRDTWLSRHTLDDVERVREALGDGTLLVRLNPWHPGSADEIDAAIARGADLLMLPMFRTLDEVRGFTRAVLGRVPVIPLAETAEAMDILPQVARTPGVSEVYIGLNDLHLSLGQRFMFEPLADGMLDRAAAQLREAGVPFGFGGLARVGEGLLPAEMIVAEHVRLGSTCAILSRTFHRQAASLEALLAEMDFPREVDLLREAHARTLGMDAAALASNHSEVRRIIARIVGEPR
jgi:2-keto-3-deoxy-L-rhamnonate aldolase RhmA